MKSNRMRLYKPETRGRRESELIFAPQPPGISIEDLPAPLPVAKVSPDQLIEDILIATLRRVQNSSSPEVAAAAARYLALLSQHAL